MISLDSSIGINIKRNYLAMAYIQRSLKGITLRHHEIIPLPSLSESREKRERVIIECIDDFVKKVRIKNPKVFLSIPRDEVLLKYLRLPPTARENLEQVIQYELEKHIPFTSEEVYFDFQVLKEEEKDLYVLLIVAKKEVIHSYLDMFSLANLYPLSLEVSSTALFNVFIDSHEAREESSRILIELGKDHWELSVTIGGLLVYSRAFAWKDNKISYFSQVKEGLRSAFLYISNEGTLNTQSISLTNLKGIILDGVDLDKQIMDEFLSQDEIPISKGFTPLRLEGTPPDFPSLTSAYGTALKGLKKVPLYINLIPKDLRRRLKRPSLIPTLVLLILIMLLGILGKFSIIIKERRYLHDLNVQIAQIEPEVSAVEEMYTQISQLRNKIAGLERIKKENLSQLEILGELTKIIPQDTWLSRFTHKRGKIQAEGYTPSASNLIAILEGSPMFFNAKFSAPITKATGGLERFKVEATIEGSSG